MLQKKDDPLVYTEQYCLIAVILLSNRYVIKAIDGSSNSSSRGLVDKTPSCRLGTRLERRTLFKSFRFKS